jgi:hypothetical protein
MIEREPNSLSSFGLLEGNRRDAVIDFVVRSKRNLFAQLTGNGRIPQVFSSRAVFDSVKVDVIARDGPRPVRLRTRDRDGLAVRQESISIQFLRVMIDNYFVDNAASPREAGRFSHRKNFFSD